MKFDSPMTVVQDVLAAAREGFRVDQVSLCDLPDWGLRDGALSHRSGGFFSVVGVAFGDDTVGDVFLHQPQSAITGLLTTVWRGRRHFLLQARAEPGTLGLAQYGPTIQSTPANYLRMHGGKATPYVEFFTTWRAGVRVLHDSVQLDLGERYLCKSKRLIVAECSPDVPVEPGYVWVSQELIGWAVGQSAFLNIDLRSLLAVSPWDDHPRAGLSPSSTAVRESLRAPLRPDVLGRVVAGLKGQATPYRLLDLNAMANSICSDAGVHERVRRQGFDVEFYQVEARGREVATWSQPLVNSRTEGYAGLACRIVGGVMEVGVHVARERGLQTGAALLPMALSYPGSPDRVRELTGRPLLRTLESDEGGRFFRDASVYELVLLETEPRDVDPPPMWLRVSELKCLLQQSNLCSIQLRGLASLLLGELPC